MISIVFQRLSRNLPMYAFVFAKRLTRISSQSCRLQNSLYFCVFKYARVVKQKVWPRLFKRWIALSDVRTTGAWNEAENRERDLGRLARFARVRLLRHALPISLLILRKKTTVLQSSNHAKKARSRPKNVVECETCLLRQLFYYKVQWIFFKLRQYTRYSHITGASNENIVPPLKHSIVERILVFKR